ncbi:hypothetical protein [Mesonia mobilis]|uniref:Peptidase S74 domain-containing protein n=1 Tax=Mesonia mobilis TaxID=369791 RepID=A0ABQ3BY45_9FLAO|nr:hypothetical protein [Mesonia mobilis]MBQ0736604.1 hypothetical protein [Aquimarina celericrescens]GGZ58267.1 hypothetical protein GCM10008088_19790 [Mesonia mobilis]
MKKRYTLFILVLLSIRFSAFAQVGVNTTDPQASLDIRASNPSSPSNSDGLLIPRISAFPSTNPTASQDGMIVYLTTTVGTNTPGFYYWDNVESDWVSFGSGGSSNNSWNVSGNVGTDSDNDFIGTTDAEALVFATNNSPKLRITTKGQLEVLNTGRSVFLGRFAGQNDDLTDNYNIFIGYAAGQFNVGGEKNIGLGYNSLKLNNSGSFNTAVGDSSLRNNESGIRNSAFGEYSLAFLLTGNYNTAFGVRSLMYNEGGQFNTAIGVQALRDNLSSYNTSLGGRSFWSNESGGNNVGLGYGTFFTNQSGSGNVGIGYRAGAYETGSDKLYIENSSSDTPLIGGDFSINRLGINVDMSDVNNLTHTLTVGGDLYADEIYTSGGELLPDYVFEKYFNGESKILPSYHFNSLAFAEQFVKENGHLPGVVSYEDLKNKNFKYNLSDFSRINLEKIEESFLYIIELNAKIEAQEKELKEKDEQIKSLEERLNKIEKLLIQK